MRERDFELALDEIANHIDDAEHDTRELLRGPLAPHNRHHVHAALVDLEHAQDKIFRARRGDPCPPPRHAKQLALSL